MAADSPPASPFSGTALSQRELPHSRSRPLAGCTAWLGLVAAGLEGRAPCLTWGISGTERPIAALQLDLSLARPCLPHPLHDIPQNSSR